MRYLRVPLALATMLAGIVLAGPSSVHAAATTLTCPVTFATLNAAIPTASGSNVTINITSDTDGEVHLHGYDIHFETKAGQVVSKTFKAVNTGDFEIEWESTSTHLGHLVVT